MILAFTHLWLYQLGTKSPELLRLDVPELPGSLKPVLRSLSCQIHLSKNSSGKKGNISKVCIVYRLHAINEDLRRPSSWFVH